MKKIKFEDLPSENTPINSANLDTLQNNIEESAVIVSSTEPQTKEKVWFQKSKNMWKNTNLTINGRLTSEGKVYAGENSGYNTSDFIPINPEETYTVNYQITAYTRMCFYNINRIFISANDTNKTFITPKNCKYIRLSIITGEKAQLEKGPISTNYEPYTENKILTKTNGVFEEFYNEENKENYSLAEQRIGTWIDGKPLYQKTIKCEKLPNTGNKRYPIGISEKVLIVNIIGIGISGDSCLPLPYIETSDLKWQIAIGMGNNNTTISISTGADRSSYDAYITIKYTKATD